jgi:hypothetical protein
VQRRRLEVRAIRPQNGVDLGIYSNASRIYGLLRFNAEFHVHGTPTDDLLRQQHRQGRPGSSSQSKASTYSKKSSTGVNRERNLTSDKMVPQ